MVRGPTDNRRECRSCFRRDLICSACSCVNRSNPLFTASKLAFEISRSAIYVSWILGESTFLFMRAESSRSAVVGRSDFATASCSSSEVSLGRSGVVDSELDDAGGGSGKRDCDTNFCIGLAVNAARKGDGGELCLNVGDVGVRPDVWKNAGFVGDVGVRG
jgi:hypothetical protein